MTERTNSRPERARPKAATAPSNGISTVDSGPEILCQAAAISVSTDLPAASCSPICGHSSHSGIHAGLMLTEQGPKLIEYNARFGDPECQVLMSRFEGDLADLLLAIAQERLADAETPRFSGDTALTVVMAAKGYPGTPEKCGAIALDTGLECDECGHDNYEAVTGRPFEAVRSTT